MNGPDKQDQSVERVLRESLKRPVQPVTDVCLDAETIAAWADGGLTGAALSSARAHVADCARCQAIVGALVETETVAAPAASPARRWFAWLVPLTAAAAALALWIALPRHDQELAPTARAPQTQVTAERSPELQQSDQVAPPSPSVVQPTQPGSVATARSTAEGSTEEKQAVLAPAAREHAEAREQLEAAPAAATAAASRLAAPEANPGQPGASNAAGAVTADRSVADAATAPSLAQKAEPSRDASPATALVGGATRERAQAPAVDSGAAASRSTPGTLAETLRAAAPSARPAFVVVSPDSSIRWRLTGPSIERSTDGGVRWEAVFAATGLALTSGVAPSPSVCWVVGRAGVVLRSDDGRRFVRVAFPEMTDLSSVRATDALSATVTAADGHVLSTIDGGATWSARPLQEF